MAESKKKRSSAVRTRVVSAETSDKPAKKSKATTKTKTAEKSAPKKAATAESSAKTKKTSLREKAAQRKKTKAQNAAATSKELGYFKGAWYELKQVRWPDRKATWSMTLAVIIFTAFFVVLVLLLDAGFKYLFDLIVK